MFSSKKKLLKLSQETRWQILKEDYWCYEI